MLKTFRTSTAYSLLILLIDLLQFKNTAYRLHTDFMDALEAQKGGASDA